MFSQFRTVASERNYNKYGRMKCPAVARTLIVSDSARLAAQSSCILSERASYLPVVDGPRPALPGHIAEVVRRNNVAARIRASRIVFAGLSEASEKSFDSHFPPQKISRVQSADDAFRLLGDEATSSRPILTWGGDSIGVGLLKALRTKSLIEFEDRPSDAETILSKSGHLVVCEAGEDLSEVIAANYAYALGAGLSVIPEIPKETNDMLMERFYALYDEIDAGFSPTQRLEELRHELRSLCGSVEARPGMSLTFISRDLPLGFGFPEVPSTHLFSYPDLGIAVANGFVAEQPRTRGSNVAVLIDPEQVEAPEIEAAARTLSKRRAFVRGYSGPGATVRPITDAVELFPYDLLIFATHCGDASGYRWTYEFTDSEGIHRTLVVDIALGIGATRQEDVLEVVRYMRFHELDGVDWNSPNKSEVLYVGSAIKDFIDRFRSRDEIEPTRKENIQRVLGSAALRMFDANYLAMPHALANNGTPIIINNACGSWHSLAERFVFAGARAYVGTLFPVSTSEAHDVLVRVLNKQWGKTLAHAFWSAQNAVYGNSPRRPYIATGIYPSKLRVTKENVPRHIARRLRQGISAAEEMQTRATRAHNEHLARRAKDMAEYYRTELGHFLTEYGPTKGHA